MGSSLSGNTKSDLDIVIVYDQIDVEINSFCLAVKKDIPRVDFTILHSESFKIMQQYFNDFNENNCVEKLKKLKRFELNEKWFKLFDKKPDEYVNKKITKLTENIFCVDFKLEYLINVEFLDSKINKFSSRDKIPLPVTMDYYIEQIS